MTDPKAATYEIADYIAAIEQLTVTTLRNVIGGMTLEETLTSRDKVSAALRIVLDEATGQVGDPREPGGAEGGRPARSRSRRRWRSRCAPSATGARRSSPPRA